MVNHTIKLEVIVNRGILNQIGWKQELTVIEEDNQACIGGKTYDKESMISGPCTFVVQGVAFHIFRIQHVQYS